MLRQAERIPASSEFWHFAALKFLKLAKSNALRGQSERDYSDVQVIVPTFVHAQLFLKAIAAELDENFIPPRIHTLFALLQMQLPDAAMPSVASSSERLMGLYAELRQHAWLKKLFTARRNADLLPLAQTLLALSDELTQALLPSVGQDKSAMEKDWKAALAQLPPPAQNLLSDESQLVWSVWQSQIDDSDGTVQRYKNLLRLADDANGELFWISPTAPDSIEQAFLARWAQHQQVQPILLDWRASVLPQPYYHAWPLLQESEAHTAQFALTEFTDVNQIRLCCANSLEDEAVQGAQTVVNWLQAGHQSIAIIAQDRVVARRIRALLERAQVMVADETGWKLSTTRAAATLAAWFEVITTRADTVALLDLLKSPYLCVFTDEKSPDAKSDVIMQIESALRRANISGGWEAILSVLEMLRNGRDAFRWISAIARQADNFSGRRTLAGWSKLSLQALHELSMSDTLSADAAGAQIMQLLQAMHDDCQKMDASFSFAEWRAFMNLQLESTALVMTRHDKRVMLLPLNGARLRKFDAVLLVGADAKHLPSQPSDVLFFANAVRRECGLDTRESRQRQQLRDFAELLLSNSNVVLSWQGHIDGEHNPVSPWIAQLNLTLERTTQTQLNETRTDIGLQSLNVVHVSQPCPVAPSLLPKTLSASAHNSLVVCPYQFFAGRMLGLSAMDELSDMPEKRDYGDWLHAILKQFHDRLSLDIGADKEQLLRQTSSGFFENILQDSPAALAYKVRWDKVIPAYIAWLNQHEQEGWKFAIGEVWCEKPLFWDGGEILLRGRIDRMDVNANNAYAVLDYKTKTVTDLRKRLSIGEDHQLPFYGLLSEQAVESASYVALELAQGKAGEVVASDFTEWTEALAQSIKESMQAIQGGAALPAQGVETACQYCDMRGLCRKGAW